MLSQSPFPGAPVNNKQLQKSIWLGGSESSGAMGDIDSIIFSACDNKDFADEMAESVQLNATIEDRYVVEEFIASLDTTKTTIYDMSIKLHVRTKDIIYLLRTMAITVRNNMQRLGEYEIRFITEEAVKRNMGIFADK